MSEPKKPRAGLLRYLAPPLGSSLQPAPLVRSGLQKGLQNQHRSHLIDDPFPPNRSVPGVVQMSVRLGRRQPLIPQMHHDSELRSQLLGKRLRLGRLRTLIPGHIQRIPDHSLRNPMLPKHPRNRLQVRPSSRTVQSKQRLCGISKRIRDRQSNPAVSNVEPQNPRNQRTLFMLSLPDLRVGHIGFKGILRHGLECNGHAVK